MGVSFTRHHFRPVFEKTFSALSLILLLPAFIVIGSLVAVSSPGPIIFRQVRIGKDQVPFLMFKFRTMREGAHHEHEALVNVQLREGGDFLLRQQDDSRTTAVGKILRRLSLDELPQLINVLQGTMSLVGPRPMLPSEIRHLSVTQMRRFDVVPGVTGLAQINGRSLLSVRDYVGYDLELINNFSIGLYFKILIITPLCILSTRGAI